MPGSVTCPGCGLELPATGLEPNPRREASAECWQLYGEVEGYTLRHPWLVRDLHQLGVDAYAAQHAPRDPGDGPPPIGVAYALVGLHLALDRGRTGPQVRAAHRRMGRPDATDLLASIAVPTLVVTGEEDAVTGPEVGRELATAIPGARFMLVEEAGHLSNLEQPEIVNEALLDFLAPLWV